MALLKHEHIIDTTLNGFQITREQRDFHDEIYMYSAVLQDQYKAVIIFDETLYLMYVFRTPCTCEYESYTELDCIFRFRETDNNEYEEMPEVPYRAEDSKFANDFFEQISSNCKELAIETQIVTGSIYRRYVTGGNA